MTHTRHSEKNLLLGIPQVLDKYIVLGTWTLRACAKLIPGNNSRPRGPKSLGASVGRWYSFAEGKSRTSETSAKTANRTQKSKLTKGFWTLISKFV